MSLILKLYRKHMFYKHKNKLLILVLKTTEK